MTVPWPPDWRDAADRPVSAPAVPPPDAPATYLPIGQFQGADYRRNAFAAGTAEEVATLRALTGLSGPADGAGRQGSSGLADRAGPRGSSGPSDGSMPAGSRVLDVGCGDARHLRALVAGDAGTVGVGLDVSPALIAAGCDAAQTEGVTLDLRVGDARDLRGVLGEAMGGFDVAWSLCQGALGTSPQSDPVVLAGLAAAVRPGGTVVVTLFHALFAARHLAPGDAFDAIGLVHHQRAEVRGPDHARQHFDLWTTSYTAREAVTLVQDAGLEVTGLRGAEPGAYGRQADGQVGLDDPELLLVARRPA